MTAPAFLDTNILLRHILSDQPEHSARASRLLKSIKAGETPLHTSQTVIFEAVYVLEKQFKAPKGRIAAILQEIVSYPSLVIPNRAAVLATLSFWTEHGGLSLPTVFTLPSPANGGWNASTPSTRRWIAIRVLSASSHRHIQLAS